MPYRFSTKSVSAVLVNSFSRCRTSSLYTPSFLIAMASKFFFNKRTLLEPSTTTLIRLAELVLTLNNFLFDDENYQQIGGVAMGTKMAQVTLTCLLVMLNNKSSNNTQDPFLILFGRYIDDCLGTASCTHRKTHASFTAFNSTDIRSVQDNVATPVTGDGHSLYQH